MESLILKEVELIVLLEKKVGTGDGLEFNLLLRIYKLQS